MWKYVSFRSTVKNQSLGQMCANGSFWYLTSWTASALASGLDVWDPEWVWACHLFLEWRRSSWKSLTRCLPEVPFPRHLLRAVLVFWTVEHALRCPVQNLNNTSENEVTCERIRVRNLILLFLQLSLKHWEWLPGHKPLSNRSSPNVGEEFCIRGCEERRIALVGTLSQQQFAWAHTVLMKRKCPAWIELPSPRCWIEGWSMSFLWGSSGLSENRFP